MTWDIEEFITMTQLSFWEISMQWLDLTAMALSPSLVTMARVVRTTTQVTQLGCCPCVLLTAYPFLDSGLNEKIFTDTAGSAMMDTPGKN